MNFWMSDGIVRRSPNHQTICDFCFFSLWYLTHFSSFNHICILNAQIVSNENINYGPYADNAHYTINKNK